MANINKVIQRNLITNQNKVVSPLSLTMACYMMAMTAKGNTLKELLNLLDTRKDKLKGDFENIISLLDGISETVKNYNHVFYDNNNLRQTNKMFKAVNVMQYDGANPEDIAKIVEEIRRETEGKVDDIEISSESVLHFINVLFFNDIWSSRARVKLGDPHEFTNRVGSSKRVPYIRGRIKGYNKFNQGVGFSVEYNNYAYLYVFMPDDMNKFMKSFEKDVDLLSIIYDGIVAGTSPKGSTFSMPKFCIKNNINLTESLLNIIPTAFSSEADFTECFSGETYTESVDQHVYFNLDEIGTEAVAATHVSNCLNCASMELPVHIRVNKPFLYMIADTEENILFAGVQNNM